MNTEKYNGGENQSMGAQHDVNPEHILLTSKDDGRHETNDGGRIAHNELPSSPHQQPNLLYSGGGKSVKLVQQFHFLFSSV